MIRRRSAERNSRVPAAPLRVDQPLILIEAQRAGRNAEFPCQLGNGIILVHACLALRRNVQNQAECA